MDEIQEVEKRGPGRPPKQDIPTMAELMKFFAERDEANRMAMMEFAKELTKVPAHEQRKIDKEAEQEKKKWEAKKAAAIAEVQSREMRMKSCSHSTYHPLTKLASHTWRGQWHTPPNSVPYFIPTCTQCWSQLPKVYTTTGDITNGVNLHEYPNLDIETLLQSAIKSGNAEEVAAFRKERNLAA